LHDRGIPFQLLEASDRVGGRLRTDLFQGFRLDRGFQVHFDAYPNAAKLLDQNRLELCPFASGALLFHDDRLDLIDQDRPLETARSGAFGLMDKLRTLKLRAKARTMDVDDLRRGGDGSTEDFLRQRGFSDLYLERFARPFFGGIFLDRSLRVSQRQFLFVFKMLSQGRAVLPAHGIEAIPRQIAESLPRQALRTLAPVAELTREGGRVTGVRLTTHETIDTETVVLATDAPQVAALAGMRPIEGSKASVCLYFETPRRVVEGPYLVLNGRGVGRVNHLAPLTNAAPSYGPPGRHLVSLTILGDPPETDAELVEHARKEMAVWFPDGQVEDWHFLRAYRIKYAQMPQPPGFADQLLRNETNTPGLYLAGEFTTNSSIDGAIESGLRCARRIAWERKG